MRVDYPIHGEGALDPRSVYGLLNSVVVPRPIAWVSSRSTGGVDNLAPHSFFTVVSVNPPMVSFTSVGVKDSLRNIRETGEFVVNLVSERHFEDCNASSTDYPPEEGEFEALGIAREDAASVAASRVADSPVAIECRLHQEVPVGDCVLVVGEVLHISVAEDVLDLQRPERPHARIEALAPLARLGRDEWATLGDIRTIRRVPYAKLGQTRGKSGAEG